MKKILFLFLVPLVGMAQSGQGYSSLNRPQVKPGFEIKGKINGLSDTVLISLLSGNDGHVMTTAKPKNGEFTLRGQLPEPEVMQIMFSGSQQGADLFIGNEKVQINGDASGLQNLAISGSAINTDYQEFKSQFNPLFLQTRMLVELINKEPSGSRRDSMVNQYNVLRPQLLQVALNYIKSKQSSVVSSLALFVSMPLITDDAELEAIYAGLKSDAKKGVFAHEVEKGIAMRKQQAEYAKIGQVGSQALEFTQKDVNGKPVALSSFRGKYVLVDFWASWCRPCRAENPNVVNAYNQFKGKNFTVLGVSLDQQKPAWLEAIKADNLTWTHVSDLQYWNNAVAQLYHIQSIPANFLIDPTGKIVARDIRGEELQHTLEKVLQ
jgi:peroxiredoxin